MEAKTTFSGTPAWREADVPPPRRFVMPVPSREQIRSGIFYMISAVLVFSLINAGIKWETARYPLGEIIFLRSVFSLIPCLAVLMASGGWQMLRTQRLKEHMGRGVMQFISIVSIFAAFAVMPLADAVAITFSAPLFLTMLSIPMLGERVGRHRWAAVLAGFLGVLLMVATGDGFGRGIVSTGALLALLSAAISASVTIAVRRMTLTEATPTLVTYQALMTLVLSAALLPLGWVTPRWDDLLLLAGVGICSGIGQYWWTQAFRFAPAAVAAPFSYLAMVWALVLGYAVWGDVPSPSLIAGAVVVAASGLYILYRETVRRVPTAAPALAGSD
jgi:drug/metabolite transporter (DMT)-like permease